MSEAIDSGMDGETVSQVELLWANLPSCKLWSSLATHEKALVCHQVKRITAAAIAQERAAVVALVREMSRQQSAAVAASEFAWEIANAIERGDHREGRGDE